MYFNQTSTDKITSKTGPHYEMQTPNRPSIYQQGFPWELKHQKQKATADQLTSLHGYYGSNSNFANMNNQTFQNNTNTPMVKNSFGMMTLAENFKMQLHN